MVRLVPINEAEFQTYRERSIQHYAQEKIEAGDRQPSEARQEAEREFQQLFPDGLASSKNAHVLSIEDQERALKVGVIAFTVNDRAFHPFAFIYDFLIFDEFRRRGYGTRALLALEEEVKKLGIDTISLHVFGHNHAARALYEKMGYEITHINMSKKVR